MDSAHRHIPTPLHPGALTILGGIPDTIPDPVSHRVRGPQHRYLPSPEPLESTGRGPSDGVWAGRPPLPLQAVLVVLGPKDVVSGATRHFLRAIFYYILGTYWLHFKMVGIWYVRNYS